MKKLFIVGCGDIGRRTARLALERRMVVHGLVRSADRGRELEEMGVRYVLGDLDSVGPVPGLPTGGASVLYTVPPPGGGEVDPRVRIFCGSVEPGEEPEKIVYLRTNGAYGDCGGAVVTEERPPNPQTARAKRRFDAETILREWGRHRGVPVVILRVTGIYGPGRLPVARIREGHPVLRAEEASFTNRIHAEDLARICLAALEKGEDGDIFNVSDGRTSTMTEYFNAVADLYRLTRPPQISLAEARKKMTPLMLSYVAESRRLDNGRMLKKLGVELLYPNLEAGLKACLEA